MKKLLSVTLALSMLLGLCMMPVQRTNRLIHTHMYLKTLKKV